MALVVTAKFFVAF